MQNYTLTGDQDRALAANMFASLQNSDPDAVTQSGSEALILSLLQGGANASPSNNPDVASRMNAIAALQNSGGVDSPALYKHIIGGLTKDYTPIRAQGRIFSRSVDPRQAIASLQGDADFLSLPEEHQDKVVEARGGGQALRAVKLMRALQTARAAQTQRIALKNEEEAQDALLSPQRTIKRMYESGDLMHDPEKGLVMKQKDAAGVETFVPANPWILGMAAEHAPKLGYGEVPMNQAQRYARELHRANPDMSVGQIHLEVEKKFPKKAAPLSMWGKLKGSISGNAPVAGAPANGVVPGAAPTPLAAGAAGANALRSFSAKAGPIKEEIPAFVLSILRNLKAGGTNAASAGVNMGAGFLGATEDVAPYYPYTSTSETEASIPDWLRTASRLNPFIPTP